MWKPYFKTNCWAAMLAYDCFCSPHFANGHPKTHLLPSSCLMGRPARGGWGQEKKGSMIKAEYNWPQAFYLSCPGWPWQKRKSNLGPRGPSPCLPLISWTNLWGGHLDMMPGFGPILKVRRIYLTKLFPPHSFLETHCWASSYCLPQK